MSNTTTTPPTPSELRQFGLMFSTVFILLFGVVTLEKTPRVAISLQNTVEQVNFTIILLSTF